MMDGKDHVLIVEDDLATLYALERLFQSQGWQVSSSRTIENALTQLESPPDWIVLDLGLIDGNGEDVLRYVREAGIPSRVAVVSGLIGPASLPGLRPLKPDVLLMKPIHFEDLLVACETPTSPSAPAAHEALALNRPKSTQNPVATPGKVPAKDGPESTLEKG
ncbi:response regulator transcription factor [Singulisphaera acidiphila]|uniref:Response regulator consisting of a CheY-like receiver domain and a Fis-type HTH domain protein n=1 Tax=Singulisphaera acidiphila (strain ATCC BAA-1392 / DSM 18658 / VKM B-2454 / MOB10) TaxID=886293 RepID=L0D5E3_SINAD|nr:response regulator [Singulisphaera acidiphila]AGA24649.1 response regulator consisting of a CheY-like receiver domain and a Fis-type HTH domain protein [Singulisphaera acidiphila DSM 18658]